MDNAEDSWLVQENEAEIHYKSPNSFQTACFSHADYQGHIVTFDLLVNVITQNMKRVQELTETPTPHLLPVCNYWKR